MRILACIWLLFCVACHKSESVGTASQTEEPQKPTAAAVSEPKEPVAAEPERLVLSADKAKAFVAYKEKYVGIMAKAQDAMKGMDAKQKSGQYDSTLGAIKGVQEMGKHGEELDKQLTAARKETGLSEAEVGALEELNMAVIMRANSVSQFAQLDTTIASMRKTIETLPPEARADAEAKVNEMKAARDQVVGLKEQREKYGDAVVDAMIGVEPVLMKLAEQAAK